MKHTLNNKIKYSLTLLIAFFALNSWAIDYSITTNFNSSTIGTIDIPSQTNLVSLTITNPIANPVVINIPVVINKTNFTYTTNYVVINPPTNSIPNKLPTVSLTSPLNNSTFTTPANINLIANASDSDGTITKVEFYSNNSLINTTLNSPYTFNYNIANAGTYSLQVKAYDNSNAVSASSLVSISVTTTSPPVTNPPAGNIWYVSSTVSASGNGKSWSTAWKAPSNISWGSIAAGDTIYIDGGNFGLSYGAFPTITANGTSSKYITISYSAESGRDGIVTVATPFGITGNYIKFDGGSYKLVGGTTYRCGIVFTCSGNTSSPVNAIGGGAINVSGARPWFRYCYFNGTYGSGSGNSLCVRNSTGFILDHAWFYQSNGEDQIGYECNGPGGSLAWTNSIFQDNNKPNRNDTSHRDVMNAWTGQGGYSYYLIGNMFFNTPGHASDQPQGDELLLQVSGKLTEILAVNNVCYNSARFIAMGSGNGGVTSAALKHNTIRVNTFAGEGTSGFSYTSQNNLGTTFANPNFINATSPLGADGIPFTDDDGFNLNSGSPAINTGVNAGVPVDIRGKTRISPDIGAYEF